MEARKLVLRDEALDIARVADECFVLVRTWAHNRGIRLERRIAAGMPRLCADERALKQILLNLLSNAVKFTPDDGVVSLGAHLAADGRFVVAVADTGIGMDEDDIAKAISVRWTTAPPGRTKAAASACR